ncbi:transcription elongation factor GreA [Microgenomates group bacterium]|nr:transcription elongation factor GreA [Microgenomates group bacterium]
MNEKPIEMTKKSLAVLEAELQDLEKVQLPAVVDRVAKAREQGDLAENSEYHDARDQQELIEVRIGEVQAILANVTIVKETVSTTKIGIGSRVKLKDEKGKSGDYEIVGEYADDADKTNTITSESAIGSALLGKTKGEKVEVKTPSGVTKTYQIMGIAT